MSLEAVTEKTWSIVGVEEGASLVVLIGVGIEKRLEGTTDMGTGR